MKRIRKDLLKKGKYDYFNGSFKSGFFRDFCCPGDFIERAVTSNNVSLFKIKQLIEHFADYDSWDCSNYDQCYHGKESCLIRAIELKDREVIKVFASLKIVDLKKPLSPRNFALDYAIKSRDADFVKFIVKIQGNKSVSNYSQFSQRKLESTFAIAKVLLHGDEENEKLSKKLKK